jgi:5-formyltetrahydrofolate cyclo-ligase
MLKKELREVYKNKRAELSLNETTQLSNKIEKNLMQLLSDLKYDNINVFLSSDSKKEVQTNSIIEKILEIGKLVSVPLSNYSDLSMKAVSFKKGDLTTKDQFGIPTPVIIEIIDSKSIAIVIVPLLCFDKRGYRCGYGKGMYDRFLNECNKEVVTIGLSFFEPIDEIIDTNKFDVPLDYVINSKTFFRF